MTVDRAAPTVDAPVVPAAVADAPGATTRTAPAAALTPTTGLLLALRAGMEAGVVLALAVWGWHAGGPALGRAALAVLAPLLGFGFWGAVDFRRAGRAAEPLRLIQELAVTGLAAAGLAAAGHPLWGWAMAAGSAVYHALVYALGQRLLGVAAPTPGRG